ncbi:MAG: hypothetical protein LAT64_07580 [Phycisphaerales bacterium]|nr:hypothetical protein [Planctomycetota bacterium]MCH8508617.1 hypothetical protein [Phycisphaerales bacterium]
MTDAQPGSPESSSQLPLSGSLADEIAGMFIAFARRLLGDTPGARAFGVGLLCVTLAVTMQIAGIWLTAILATSVTHSMFFVALGALYTALAGLLALCGVMTMLAGAIRYGVGASDR